MSKAIEPSIENTLETFREAYVVWLERSTEHLSFESWLGRMAANCLEEVSMSYASAIGYCHGE